MDNLQNDKFYNYIAAAVSRKISRPLLKSEKTEATNFIKNIKPELLAPEYYNKTVTIMVSTLASEFKKHKCDQPPPDTTPQNILTDIGISSESNTAHGIYDNSSYKKSTSAAMSPPTTDENSNQLAQQSDISISNLLSVNNMTDAVRALNPESLLRKIYLVLDSRYRVLDTTGSIQEFKWNYILQTASTNQGSVSVIGNVRDIVAMRVYPFRIPYISSADNKYARISVFIKEFAAQSFVAHENRNFHFMLQSETDGAFINLLTDTYNDGYFYLEKPITTVENLTISFGSPLEPVTFDKDRDTCQIDYFIIAPLTKITVGYPTPTEHNLANGDRVYFSKFDVGAINPVLVEQVQINQRIKRDINREEGFIVTVIDPYSFSIDYDSSDIQNPLPDPLAIPKRDIFIFDVFYGSKRIFMPMELTYIMPEITNA
jgi:hypothetical protein